MKWFKMDAAIYENAKAQSLDGPVFKTWINLLGVYARNEGFPSAKQMAYVTRLSAEQLQIQLDILIKEELLDQDAEGNVTPHDWEEHNLYDLSTERVQKHREAKKRRMSETVSETDETDETCFTVSRNEQEMSKQMSKANEQEMSKVSKQVFVGEITETYSDEQMSKPISYSNGQQFTHEQSQVIENNESVKQNVTVSETMKRSRIEEKRIEENRREKHSHLNPLSLADEQVSEQGNEQTPPDANPASSVSAVSLNGNGKPHPKAKPAILNPEQQTWFDGLWLGYWRKNDKHPALVAFGKQIRTESAFQQLVSAFDRDKAEMLTRPIDKRPCLGPWINKKPWLDDDLASVPEQVRTSPKEAANEAVYQEILADLRKGKTQ